MAVERISIEGNTLYVELGGLEARVMSRAHVLIAPLLRIYITMMCRLVLVMVSLGKEKFKEMQKGMERGENMGSICEEAGIDVRNLIDKSIEWPTDQEIDEALGWLED